MPPCAGPMYTYYGSVYTCGGFSTGGTCDGSLSGFSMAPRYMPAGNAGTIAATGTTTHTAATSCSRYAKAITRALSPATDTIQPALQGGHSTACRYIRQLKEPSMHHVAQK